MSDDASRALRAWSWPGEATPRANCDGLINQTFVVDLGGVPVAVLQRLNTRIFVPEVHEDIEAVTSRLAAVGVPTPRLLRTVDGTLWHTETDGAVWRCLTHEGDRTVHKIGAPQDAREAGSLVARFHAAVRDLRWDFRSVRAGAHDTQAHMTRLVGTTEAHRGHRLYDEVAPIADEVLARWGTWDGPTGLPRRVVHGDLKVSNVRFLKERAHCLIDLDTLARDTLDVDLGDAMRSWCNPASEDAAETKFDVGVFEAAMAGYGAACRQGDGPTEAEWRAVVPGVERVSLELAARFARDALEETYFGWNPRFGSRGDHNLLRARGQLSLALSIRSATQEAERVIEAARRASLA